MRLVEAGSVLLAIDVLAGLGALGALIAAFGVGSIVAAVIGARKERDLQLREKMLAVADDFISASNAALAQLRALEPTESEPALSPVKRFFLGKMSKGPGDLDSKVANDVQGSIDDASRQVNRVVLLFSPMSRAATEAGRASTKLSEAWEALSLFYMITRGLQAESVDQRRNTIRRSFEEVRDVGLEAAFTANPTLQSDFGPFIKAALTKAWEFVEGRAASLDEPLEEASTGAKEALEEASDALDKFASYAGSQALDPRAYKVVEYEVTREEEIVVSLHPRRRLSRRLRSLFY